MNNKTKGYLLGAIAAITYGMNPLFTLPLYTSGMNPDSVLFFRYLLAIPIMGAMLKMRGRNFKVEKKAIVPLFLLGLLFSLSSLTLFQSYNYMDAGIASTMLFVYPIMVSVIMTVFFKEKLKVQTVVCIVMALAGIGLLYKGENGATLNLVGTLLIFGSALSYAIYLVSVNRPILKDIATLKLTFYVLLSGITLYSARLLVSRDFQIPGAGYLWLNLLALAIFPTAISLLCTTKAIQYIGSTPTAILGAMEPVTAVFFGVLVFDEAFTPRIATGLVLIITAVSLVVAGGTVSNQIIRLRKMFPRLPLKRRRK